jgi:hypothetical protein
MESEGAGYLFNLSLLAVTFAAISVLVMLIRQTMGGKLTNFDVYLITSYIAIGFVIAIDAMLPPLISYYGMSLRCTWGVASALGAVLLAAVVATFQLRRRHVTGVKMPIAVLVTYSVHWIAAILLAANALSFQLVSVFASALTLSMAVLMWTFVRRVSTLLGDRVGEDWDPSRG